ncbi:hypothetical protein PoB_005195300 [Plakobranchus ocellatus]|uniref:Uncharacterized protein n=1 Tax=Plakobranchus ocellatus TaxID=259542 RepID=A0AAV4C0N1_9GAST|nr:hypothetical protein PoB_005195300 [Plakobranchus ocellatus]
MSVSDKAPDDDDEQRKISGKKNKTRNGIDFIAKPHSRSSNHQKCSKSVVSPDYAQRYQRDKPQSTAPIDPFKS